MKLKTGFFKGSFFIVYCGMPNDETFVLAPLKSFGYSGFSPNIYYNSKSTKINFFNEEIDIKEVTPDYIRIYI